MNNIINKAPIIGFVRYSQKIKFGNNKIERDVFEVDYFEYRYNIFKNVTLKSFQNQTNSNFVLLLLHSENMPAHYKERFLELEKANVFLYNIFVEDTQESFNEALLNSANYASFENEVAITFRIDNDDAVQRDFIDKLSEYLKRDFNGHIVSIPKMYRVKRIKSQFYMLEEFYFPANAIGLAYITNSEQYKTIFNLGDHNLVNNKNSMILLPNFSNGGLMTINGENEINSIDNSKAITINKVDLYKYLEEQKIDNLDLGCLRIFNEPITNTKNSLKKVVLLIVPPIFSVTFRKLRNIFTTK